SARYSVSADSRHSRQPARYCTSAAAIRAAGAGPIGTTGLTLFVQVVVQAESSQMATTVPRPERPISRHLDTVTGKLGHNEVCLCSSTPAVSVATSSNI